MLTICLLVSKFLYNNSIKNKNIWYFRREEKALQRPTRFQRPVCSSHSHACAFPFVFCGLCRRLFACHKLINLVTNLRNFFNSSIYYKPWYFLDTLHYSRNHTLCSDISPNYGLRNQFIIMHAGSTFFLFFFSFSCRFILDYVFLYKLILKFYKTQKMIISTLRCVSLLIVWLHWSCIDNIAWIQQTSINILF